MIELVLIRHGETDGNLQPTALGTTDLPLNPRGKRQAQSLARLFGLSSPVAIYSSPLKRAADTANCINEKHHLTIDHVLDLSERDFGVWEGLSVNEIRTSFPEAYEAWQNDPADYVISGGESGQEAFQRHSRCIDTLLKRHEAGSVLVVTHLGAIRNMLAHLLGMGFEGTFRFHIENGAVCRLQIDQTGFACLKSFNEI